MSTTPSSKLSILIVDDEPLARQRLRDVLSDISHELPNEVVAVAEDGLAALQAIGALDTQALDVALVDIRMPKMDGIELARHLALLDRPPAVLFVTAFDRYAVQAFELNAIDYLLKPVRAPRLVAALQKVKQIPHPPESGPAPSTLANLPQRARTHLSVHERGRLLLIPLPEIIYFKADLKYVAARTAEREYLLNESLTCLETEFAEHFVRLHRGILVAKEAIAGFAKSPAEESETQWEAMLHQLPERLPISRRQWPLVKSYATTK